MFIDGPLGSRCRKSPALIRMPRPILSRSYATSSVTIPLFLRFLSTRVSNPASGLARRKLQSSRRVRKQKISIPSLDRISFFPVRADGVDQKACRKELTASFMRYNDGQFKVSVQFLKRGESAMPDNAYSGIRTLLASTNPEEFRAGQICRIHSTSTSIQGIKTAIH